MNFKSLLLASAVGVALLSGCKTDHKILINAERTSAFDLYSEGEYLESQGQYQSALNSYLRAQEISPRPAFTYKIGELYHRMGNPSKAIPLYEQAIAEAPDFELAKAQLSLAETQIRESTSSEDIQKGFEDKLPTEDLESNNLPDQITTYRPAKAEQPIVERLPKPEVQQTIFPELNTEGLSNAELLEKAKAAEANGQWDDAASYYQEIRQTDLSEEMILAHVKALGQSGRLRRADEILQENVVFLTPSESYYVTWSNILAKSGNLDKTETLLQTALKSYPDSAKIKNNLGALYLKRGLYQESTLVLEELLSKNPDFLPAQYNLALAYVELGNYGKARRLLEKYIADEGEEAANAQNLLENPVFFP